MFYLCLFVCNNRTAKENLQLHYNSLKYSLRGLNHYPFVFRKLLFSILQLK